MRFKHRGRPVYRRPLFVPRGFCGCGCGGRTAIADKTDTRSGAVRGQPRRFLKNHQLRGHTIGPRSYVPASQLTRCAEPMTSEARARIALARLADARRAYARAPHDLTLRLAYESRRRELHQIRRVMEHSA